MSYSKTLGFMPQSNDMSATDKKLRHLVVNDLKFDERYEVAVVSEPSEFLTLIEQIL